MDRNKLYEDLKRDEGYRLEAYRDSNGHWTIGVGHLIDFDPERKIEVPRITRITPAECRAWWDADTNVAESAIVRVLSEMGNRRSMAYSTLTDVRQRALVNMMFNRGEKRFRESTTITPAIVTTLAQLTPDWRPVAAAIKASPWAVQIGARAERLAYMLETGKDPV